MPDSGRHRATALDFATRNVWEIGSDDQCVDDMREMKEAYGDERCQIALDIVRGTKGDEKTKEAIKQAVMQALRAYTLLLMEQERKGLTVQIVGKLSKLELCTGKRIDLRQLGRENNISKQAVQNRMKVCAARLNLDLPDSTPEQRKSHRLMNRRNYGRRPLTPAHAHQ